MGDDDTMTYEQRADAAAESRCMKDDVNAFLWTRLPGEMSMFDAEAIAADVHNLIVMAWAGTPTERGESDE